MLVFHSIFKEIENHRRLNTCGWISCRIQYVIYRGSITLSRLVLDTWLTWLISHSIVKDRGNRGDSGDMSRRFSQSPMVLGGVLVSFYNTENIIFRSINFCNGGINLGNPRNLGMLFVSWYCPVLRLPDLTTDIVISIFDLILVKYLNFVYLWIW